MAKARNIYGVGQAAEVTLPRSRGARQRLVSLLQPVAPIIPVLSPFQAPMVQAPMACPACPPCEGIPVPPQATQAPAPAPVPAGVQLSAEVPYFTNIAKSAIVAQVYSTGQATIDAFDGAGRSVRLVTTSAPGIDQRTGREVIEAWDAGRGFATNVALANLG